MSKRRIKQIVSSLLIIITSAFALLSSSCNEKGESFVTSDFSSVENADVISVMYIGSEGGYVTGNASQKLNKGERAKFVEAVPQLCYTFKEWSDGVKTARREGDSFSFSTTVMAVFEYVGLPRLYIEYTADVIHKSYPVDARFTVDNTYANDLSAVSGQIQGRGNSTWKYEKQPYKIKLDSAVNLLGIGDEAKRDWVLLSNHCDQSLLRNYYAYNLANRVGIGYKSTLLEVYLNGKYNGVYLLTGKAEDSRLDVEPEDGGFLVELYDYFEGEEDVDYFTVGTERYTIHSDLTKDQIADSKKYIADVSSAITSGNKDRISELIDVNSFVDMYLLQEYTKNIDAGWSSFYMFRKDENDVLHLGPAWDFDIAMGNDCRLDGGGYDGIYVGRESGMVQQMWWFIQLCRQEWFRELVSNRWNTTFGKQAQDVLSEMKEYAKVNLGDIENNFSKWNNVFGNRINCEPEHIMRFKSYEKHYTFFVSWLEHRMNWLDDCFNDNDLWLREINNKKNPEYTRGKLPNI